MAELVLQVLARLWAALSPLQVPMAVMGGIAVSMWKHVRATRDVDVLVAVGAEGEVALIRALKSAGFRPKREPPVLRLGEYRLLQLLYEPAGSHLDLQVDLMLVGSEYHLRALERRVTAPLPELGITVAVLACEDLILNKLAAGRLLDRADVGALLRANAASLDFAYLSGWAAKLDVLGDLETLWREAMPGSELPPGSP